MMISIMFFPPTLAGGLYERPDAQDRFHNAVTTLCQEPIQVCQASPISFGHRIVSNSISVQIIADHDGMFHGAEKSPQISAIRSVAVSSGCALVGEHLIGQQRRDAVQQKKHRYDPPVPSKQASFVPVPGLQIPCPPVPLCGCVSAPIHRRHMGAPWLLHNNAGVFLTGSAHIAKRKWISHFCTHCR